MLRISVFVLALFVYLSSAVKAAEDQANGFEIAVDENGGIHMPEVDFRAEWTMLGTFAIAGETSADEFHVVYTQPGVAQRYRETGEFPDGAVLIKEVLGTATEDMTTGKVFFAKKTTGWFVMVKSTKPRFEGHPIWGDGWGWAYFDVEDSQKTITSDYQAECRDCHVPARETDWIYIRGYPVLRGR